MLDGEVEGDLHLAAIAFVPAEALLGIACPLTVWEDMLRGGVQAESFIGRWVRRLLFYEAPEWLFTAAYVAWAAVTERTSRAALAGALGITAALSLLLVTVDRGRLAYFDRGGVFAPWIGWANSTRVPPDTPSIPLPVATGLPVNGAKLLGPPVGTRPKTLLAGIAPNSAARARAGASKKATSLTDAVRATTDTPGLYTFWDYQAGAWQRNNGIRIDHLLLSPQAADRVAACDIDKAPRAKERASDHTPIWCELAI